MRHNIAKTIAIALAVSLVSLTGCGKQSSSNSASESISDVISTSGSTVESTENSTINNGEEPTQPDSDSFLTGWDRWIRDDNKSSCKKVTVSPDNCEITRDGDQITMISVKDEDGKTIRMQCEGISISSDGWYFEFSGNASMCMLDALGGIKYIDTDCVISAGMLLFIDGMFSIQGKTSVETADNLTFHFSDAAVTSGVTETSFTAMPNYLRFRVNNMDAKLHQISIYYTGIYTQIKNFYMNPDFYNYYLEGEKYDSSREQFSLKDGVFDFYVNAVPDSKYLDYGDSRYDIYGIDNITPNNLHRADGSIKSKDEVLEVGDYMDFIFNGETIAIDSFVLPKSHAGSYYEAIKDGVVDPTGDLHVMVLPILFSDQSWNEADEDELKKLLGKVIDEAGVVTEYEAFSGQETLSSYFEKSSYGKLHIDYFVAKPYEFKTSWGENFTFEEGRERSLDEGIICEFANWINEQYDDLSGFDRDGNGLFDAVIVVNPGDMTGYTEYNRTGMGYAVEYRNSYGPELARTDGELGINYLACCTLGALHEGGIRGVNDYNISTFVHEFSHEMGLIDYYDVNGKGISAIGSFDMQDHNTGDWNAYSKYAVGWIEPKVVLPSQLDADGSVEITINAYATSGDCIVIPTKQSEAEGIANIPFSEYILVDLFTSEGLYSKDAAIYKLDGVSGVRMYHVDARCEERVLKSIKGEEYTVGTHHFTNAYNAANKYALSLIQASGKTNLLDINSHIMDVAKDDFFKAGSSFSVKKFGTYFDNGKMNDGSDFPYTVTVKSISNGQAVIQISK